MFEDLNRQTAEILGTLGQAPSEGIKPVRPGISNVKTGVPLKSAPGGFSQVPPEYGFVGEEPNRPETGSVAPSMDTQFYKMRSGLEGQMSVDPNKPSRVIKSARLDTPEKVKSLRQGLPGSLFQVDHILPLWGGGTNNDENKQILTNAQHLQKTRVEDVARSLYYAGKVSLPQALTVAMNWQNKDIKGIEVDDQDNVELGLAQQKWDEWQQDLVKPKKVGIKEWWNTLTSKEFREGKDVAEMMPDTALGEFGKGLISGASLGYIKSQHEDYEGSDSFVNTVANVAGHVLGMLPSFVIGGAAVKVGAKVAAPIAAGTRVGEVLSQIAGRAPGAVFKISPKVAKVVHSAATFSLVGQVSAQNENSSRVERLLKDIGSGTVFGLVSPSMLGSFQAMAATYVLAAAEGAGVKDSLANSLVIGVLHAGGALSGKTEHGETVEQALSRATTQEAVKFRQDLGIGGLRFLDDGTPYITAKDAADNFMSDNAKLYKEAGIKDPESITPEQLDVYQQLALQHKFFTRELYKNGLPPDEKAKAHWEDFMSLAESAEKLSSDTFTGVPSRVTDLLSHLGKVETTEAVLPPEVVQKFPSNVQPIVTGEVQFLPTGQGRNARIKNNLQKFLTRENVVDNPLRVVGILRSEPEFSTQVETLRAKEGKPARMNPEDNVEWFIIDRDGTPHRMGFQPDLTTSIKQNEKMVAVEAPEIDIHATRENIAQAMRSVGTDIIQGELVATPLIREGRPVEGTYTNIGERSKTEFARIRIRPQHWSAAFELSKLPKDTKAQEAVAQEKADITQETNDRLDKAFTGTEGGPAALQLKEATRGVGEALKLQNPIEIQKSLSDNFGLEISAAEAKEIAANSGKLTVGDLLSIMAIDAKNGVLSDKGRVLFNAFKTIPKKGREQIWNVTAMEPAAPAPKAAPVTAEAKGGFKQPTMERDPDGTWWLENTTKTGKWADFIKEGHKVEWNLRAKPSGKGNYSDYLNRVRIDGKVMTKDEAFKMLEKASTTAKENTNFRKVIDTSKDHQTVAMSIPKGSDIGSEKHEVVKQTITIKSGTGEAIKDGKKTPLKAGDTVVVEPKTEHNIVNKGEEPLKILTVYEPPNHPEGTVHKTKADAKADKVDEAFSKKVNTGKVSVIPLKPKEIKQVPKEWKTASTKSGAKELTPEQKSGPVTVGKTEGLRPDIKKFTFWKDKKPGVLSGRKASIPDTQTFKRKAEWTVVPDPKQPGLMMAKLEPPTFERPEFHAGIDKTPLEELLKKLNKKLPDNWDKMTEGRQKNWIADQMKSKIKTAEEIVKEEAAPGVDSLEREVEMDKEGAEPTPPRMDEVIDLLNEGDMAELSGIYQTILSLEKDPITTISEKWIKLKPMIHNRFVRAVKNGEMTLQEAAQELTAPGESIGDTMLALTEDVKGAEKIIYGKDRPLTLGQDLSNTLASPSGGDKTLPYVLREILGNATDKKRGITMLDDAEVLEFMNTPKFKKALYGDEGQSSGEYLKTIALLAKVDPKLSSKDRARALTRIYDYARTKKADLEVVKKKAYKNLSEKDMIEKDLIENKIHQTEVLENYLKDVTEFDKLGPKKLAKSIAPMFRTMAENEANPLYKNSLNKLAESFERISDSEAGAELATGFALKLIEMVNEELGTNYHAPNATRFKMGVKQADIDKTISDIVSKMKQRTPSSLLRGEKIFKTLNPEKRKAWLEDNPEYSPE